MKLKIESHRCRVGACNADPWRQTFFWRDESKNLTFGSGTDPFDQNLLTPFSVLREKSTMKIHHHFDQWSQPCLLKQGVCLIDISSQELIEEADLDGDGNINYEEFITMLFKVNITGKTKVKTDAIFWIFMEYEELRAP